MDEITDEVKCPCCGQVLGEIVVIDGLPLLRMGHGLCRAWYGSCSRCGESVSWSLSSIALKRLIEKVLQSGEK